MQFDFRLIFIFELKELDHIMLRYSPDTLCWHAIIHMPYLTMLLSKYICDIYLTEVRQCFCDHYQKNVTVMSLIAHESCLLLS